jgi:hypothetical protein
LRIGVKAMVQGKLDREGEREATEWHGLTRVATRG